MPRGRKLETLADYKRSLKNGFGLGKGKYYKPWLRVQDVGSRGVSSKVFGIKTQREHHMLSNLETQLFYLAEFSESVIDIREQFPLLPLTLSSKIAKSIDIDHPVVPKSQELNVLTTDVLLTINTPKGVNYEAISVKPLKDLKNPRVAEKLDLERAWWEAIDIPFHIFTGNNITKIQSNNISWATNPLRHGVNFDIKDISKVLGELSVGKITTKEIINIIVSIFHFDKTEAMQLIQFLIGCKYLEVDLNYLILKEGIVNIKSIDYKSMEVANVSN
jgi:hypothetical protein